MRTFWTTLPGILTGVAALITALVGVVALFPGLTARERVVGQEPAVPAVGSAAPAEPSMPLLSADPAAGPVGSAPADPCFAGFLEGVPADRRWQLHDGSREQTLLGPTVTKRGPIGLELVSGGQVVGGLRFAFTTQGEFFTIDRVVDAGCGTVETFANASRGGDKHVLQNWDEVRITLAGNSYLLRFGYSGGELGIGYFHRIVE